MSDAYDEYELYPSDAAEIAGAYEFTKYFKKCTFYLSIAPPLLVAIHKTINGEAPNLSLDYFFDVGDRGFKEFLLAFSGTFGTLSVLSQVGQYLCGKKFTELSGEPPTEEVIERYVSTLHKRPKQDDSSPPLPPP